MDRRTLIIAGFAAAAAPGAAFAQVYSSAVSREDRELVDKATAYLQGLTTARGRFSQENSRGGSFTGALLLNRPGKARFEYDAPAQMLVVADGRNVSVYDRRLKTFDRYPLGATPLGIFLARRIRFDREVMVTRVARAPDGFAITLQDARRNTEGSLTLDFQNQPVALRGWTVVDPQGVQTRVRLQDFAQSGALDPALFVLNDPTRG